MLCQSMYKQPCGNATPCRRHRGKGITDNKATHARCRHNETSPCHRQPSCRLLSEDLRQTMVNAQTLRHKALVINSITIQVLLRCERVCIATQDIMYCVAKQHLLQSYMNTAEMGFTRDDAEFCRLREHCSQGAGEQIPYLQKGRISPQTDIFKS